MVPAADRTGRSTRRTASAYRRGLWRRSTKARPGSMTAFIRAERLLPGDEIDRIVRDAPTELTRFQDVAAAIPLAERPTLGSWLDRFHAAFPDGRRRDVFALAA